MKRISPPSWIDRILEWYCADRFLEEVQGDLHEWYEQIHESHRRTANLRYFIAVFQYFSFFRTKSFQKLIANPNFLSMKSIIIITYRNFKKSKFSGLVRLFNLALGIGVFLLALVYAQYELSYEAHHENSDSIYRIGFSFDSHAWAATPLGLGSFAIDNISEVSHMTRFLRIWETTIKNGDRQFYEDGGFLVDSTVFEMFTHPMIHGNPKTALKEKMSIVLTERTAKRYFGDKNPLGQTLELSMDLEHETGTQAYRVVTGVIEDIPEQSHLKFDFLLPAHTYPSDFLVEWRNFWVYTFVKIAGPQGLQNTRSIIRDKYLSLRGLDEDSAEGVEVVLTPLRKIHLYTNHEKEYADNGNIYYVYILFSIGLFILIVSSINFINLTIIQGLDRAKEVGLRKTVGASRWQLIFQFMSENLVLLVSASILCLLALAILEPFFHQFSGLDLPLNVVDHPQIGVITLMLLIILEMVSGVYPAFVLSKFRPADIIKAGGQSVPMKRVSLVRKALIVLQFSISLVLVIGSVIVYGQLAFIQNKDLGFEKDQVLLINLNSSVEKSLDAFENELYAIPGIQSISTSSSAPGYRIMVENSRQLSSEEEFSTRLLIADENFIDTYDIELIAGRPFTKDPSSDFSEFILNETAAKQLFGPSDPFEEPIILSRDTGYVVGIVKDFNFKSLHSEIDPLSMINYSLRDFGFASIKFDAQSTTQVLAAIEMAYTKVYPNLPSLSYEFLDARFEQLYMEEIKLRSIVWLFCLITILLTVSGILSIATYSAKKRAKEIAIRKVLGGSFSEIIGLLSRNFVYLLLLSLVVGVPGAFFLSDWWLQDFAYRIAIDPMIFIISTLAMTFLIMASFSLIAFQTVRTNPAKVLRSE